MQAKFPGPVRHQAPGVLVDDLDAAIADQVVLVPKVKMSGAQGLLHQQLTATGTQPGAAKGRGEFDQTRLAEFRQCDVPVAGTHGELAPLRVQLSGELERLAIDGGVELVVTLAGKNERRPRFIDEDAVGLVDDAETQPPQAQIIGRDSRLAVAPAQAPDQPLHVAPSSAHRYAIAEVVESELFVGAVGDIARVGGLPGPLILEVLRHDADGQAQDLVER